MKICYHATSYANASQIIANGFKKGTSGMFGGGIYFAEMPENALRKAHAKTLDCILVVKLNVGRLKTEQNAHNSYDLQTINKLGYDSVEIRNIRTGPEICIYEPHRVRIVCIVHWTDQTIEFNEITGLDVNLAAFQSLIEGRQLRINRLHDTISKHNFMFNNNNSLFKGILNYIQGVNANLVDIDVSSICSKDKNNYPQNVINYNDKNSSFCTDDLENQWICFDFKNHKVTPKHYSIRTYNMSSNLSHLKSWVIEGSDSYVNWDELDNKTNCSSLNGPNYCVSYSLNNPNDKSYRYLRLRQTGLNWRRRNYLKINCIEFYGEIK